MIDAAGTVSYILDDQVGQPQKMLDAGGGITWSRVSGIYGDTVTQLAGTTAANPQRFPGQQYDPFTNLHYNYFRDYDPATGRYVEADPIGLEGGVNLYAYVGGNPVTWADPKGLDKYNLFPFAEPSMQQAADREYQDLPRTVRDGWIHIFGHASKNVFCVYSRSGPYCLNPAQFVKWLENNHVNPNKPIKLWGCSTAEGENSFAQRLSNLLGGRTVVAANKNTLWNSGDGFVGMKDGGHWIRFGKNP